MAKATFKCKECGDTKSMNFTPGNKVESPICKCGAKMNRILNSQGLGSTVSDMMIGIGQSFLYK